MSWSVPADNGAPITVYEATTGGSTCAVVPPATRCTLVGLDGGTTYAVRVVAINEVGTSPPSASASGTPTVPSERPSAPSAAVARRGDGRVTVSWRAAEPRGAAITGYAAVASPGGASCTAVPPALRCAIAGLRNGTAYTVAIVATNANGSGEPARTGVVVPAGPPSTPPGVAVALRGRIATVACARRRRTAHPCCATS